MSLLWLIVDEGQFWYAKVSKAGYVDTT